MDMHLGPSRDACIVGIVCWCCSCIVGVIPFGFVCACVGGACVCVVGLVSVVCAVFARACAHGESLLRTTP